jgi:hypothetical protein
MIPRQCPKVSARVPKHAAVPDVKHHGDVRLRNPRGDAILIGQPRQKRLIGVVETHADAGPDAFVARVLPVP